MSTALAWFVFLVLLILLTEPRHSAVLLHYKGRRPRSLSRGMTCGGAVARQAEAQEDRWMTAYEVSLREERRRHVRPGKDDPRNGRVGVGDRLTASVKEQTDRERSSTVKTPEPRVKGSRSNRGAGRCCLRGCSGERVGVRPHRGGGLQQARSPARTCIACERRRLSNQDSSMRAGRSRKDAVLLLRECARYFAQNRDRVLL